MPAVPARRAALCPPFIGAPSPRLAASRPRPPSPPPPRPPPAPAGLTPQYEGLEALQKKFGPRGFTVVGFPCNQFGAQESGTEHEIQEFCKTKYSVSFPLTAKVDVNGDNTHPLWAWLKKEHGGILQSVKWNFAKFLIGAWARPGGASARSPRARS